MPIDTAHLVTGLTNSTRYTFGVAVVDDLGEEYATVTTTVTPRPTASADLATLDMHTDQLALVRSKWSRGVTLESVSAPNTVSAIRSRASGYSGGTWDGPTSLNSGRVQNQQSGNLPNYSQAEQMRDAAFSALMDGTHQAKAKAALLEQVTKPRLDFSDATLYPLAPVYLDSRNPSITFGAWGGALFKAWDYLDAAGALSSGEQETLADWFYQYANFWIRAVTEWASASWNGDGGNYGGPGSDRWSRTRNLSTFGAALTGDLADRHGYRDSQGLGSRNASNQTVEYRRIGRVYDNQHSAHIGPAGAIVQKLVNDGYTVPAGARNWSLTNLKFACQLWVEEFLGWCCYPDGSWGELHRGPESGRPNRGWTYSAEIVQDLLHVTDAWARSGDRTLLDLSITGGANGSQDSAGYTVQRLARDFMRYAQQTNATPSWPVTGSRKRYGTTSSGNVGSSSYLIDARNGSDRWTGHYLAGAQGALLFDDDDFEAASKGQLSGFDPLYTSGLAGSLYYQWSGARGALPSALLIHGDMRGQIVHPAAEA